MKKLYQRTFEQVLAQTCPPLNRVEEQRRALASRCSCLLYTSPSPRD